MLDLLWRARFRWKLWPRQATGHRKYGTEENLVAIEDQHIRPTFPHPTTTTARRSLARRSSSTTPSVMSTSVRRAKTCTTLRPIPRSDLADIGRPPRTAITAPSKPGVLLASRGG